MPYLVRHGHNGLVYRTGRLFEFREFRKQVLKLCQDEPLQKRLGVHAYETIAHAWNPKEAADRLYRFCEGLMIGKVQPEQEGPLESGAAHRAAEGVRIYQTGRIFGMKRVQSRKTKSRIYVCHTFYHVYVAVLKEMKLVRETSKTMYQKADIALSSVSTDFEHLGDRLTKTGIFQNVIALDEKREDFFPELAKYRKNYKNILKHMINRMIFTKKTRKVRGALYGGR